MQVRALDPHGPQAEPWFTAFQAGGVAGRDHPIVADGVSLLTSLRTTATLVKSANLARLAAEFPRVRHLHTWTADGNHAMIATNRRFGFRPVETTHTMEASV